MVFYSTDKGIQQAKREMDENLGYARDMIGETDLERDITALYDRGHPGWASLLSKHYMFLVL